MKLSSRRVNVRLESTFVRVVRSITTVLHEEKDSRCEREIAAIGITVPT